MYFLVGNFKRDDEGFVSVVKKERLTKQDFENACKINTFQILQIDGHWVRQYVPNEDVWEEIVRDSKEMPKHLKHFKGEK